MTKEIMYEASLLISQALGEIEDIVDAKDQRYAEPDEHCYSARRKFTLKDAKPKARCAASLLRKAWEMLDPVLR